MYSKWGLGLVVLMGLAFPNFCYPEKDAITLQMELDKAKAENKRQSKDAEKALEYLMKLQQAKEAPLFVISQLNSYVDNYSNFKDADKVLFAIAEIYGELKSPALSLASYLKLKYLFTESPFVAKANKKMESILRDKKEQELLKEIQSISVKATEKDDQRFFDYLSQLNKMANPELHDYLLSQGSVFLTNYPAGSQAPAVQSFIARTYEEMEKPYEAIAAYFKVIYLYPEYSQLAEVYFKIGRIYAQPKIKEYQKAREIYQEVCSRYPDSDEAKKAEKAISKLGK